MRKWEKFKEPLKKHAHQGNIEVFLAPQKPLSLFCHEKKTEVDFTYCIEHCTNHRCLDQDVIYMLSRSYN